MENFIVSARKYRPVTFNTVVGQQTITSTLKNAIRNNTVAQAFLFCGPRGVGKTTCARIMAKTINCLNPTPDVEACNECASCKAFNNNASFNIYELDAASNNSVEDIRNLVEQVRIPPQIGNYKVYIIDEVHMLSAQAFNAFLKTLEEPPAYAKFILATTEKHKILPTILSRCQIFDFKRITPDDIAKHLAYVAQQEGVEAEPEALSVIAQKADGALRDSLSIFDQMVSFTGKKMTYKDVINSLNVLDNDTYFQAIDHILNGDISSTLLLINDIIERGFEPQHFINGFGTHLRDLLVSKDTATTQLIETSDKMRQRYAEQATKAPLPFLIKALAINDQCDIDYRNSNNKRLHLEIALMKMCALCNANLSTPVNTAPVTNTIATAPKPQPQPQPQAQQPVQQVQPKPQVQQPVQQVQPKPQVQQQAPQPATPVQTSPTPTNTQPQTQTEQPQQNTASTPIIRRRTNTTSSISINTVTENKTEEIIETEKTTPFTEQQLVSEWKAFVESYKAKSPNFANLIGKYQPTLKENFKIMFEIDNQPLYEHNTEGVAALKNHLKDKLKNNVFTLNPVIVEKPVVDQAYTDKDKFEKMVEKRPLLNTMRNELKLEGDL